MMPGSNNTNLDIKNILKMKKRTRSRALSATILFSFLLFGTAPPMHAQENTRAIEFPDIPGFTTLKCDFHMHTVFSDGSVWPDIRVQEALRDGLDAISITDHLEYQPKREDIPHTDRNRSYQLAQQAARGSELMVINGAEITRSMPPGHANAIFLKDANKLNVEDYMEAFKEARNQGAFVFWNHPHWTAQQKNGVATLQELHMQLISDGYLHGIEVFNESTYSDEALEIANRHHLTLMGNSDIHGLIDWQFDVPSGGHRPVTLVFAREKSEAALKEALEQGRTAVWFNNTLVGDAAFLAPLVQNSLEVTRDGEELVQTLVIENHSDADFMLENLSDFTFHNQASTFMVKSHASTELQVKTVEVLPSFILRFRVLNAITAPGEHPEISILVE